MTTLWWAYAAIGLLTAISVLVMIRQVSALRTAGREPTGVHILPVLVLACLFTVLTFWMVASGHITPYVPDTLRTQSTPNSHQVVSQ